MKIEDARQYLKGKDFKIHDGDYILQTGNGEYRTPAIGVEVSSAHTCLDLDCQNVHMVATVPAIEMMTEYAFQCMIVEELENNR